MSTSRWFYSGDVNIEHGGMFYTLSSFDDGWSDVVRVLPCSDAGGADNVWWVEALTVPTDDAKHVFTGVGETIQARRAHRMLHFDGALHERIETHVRHIEDALACGGWDDLRLAQWDNLTRARRRHAIVQALVGYGRYDLNETHAVQIGRVQHLTARYGERVSPTTTLRAGSSLRRWVRDTALYLTEPDKW